MCGINGIVDFNIGSKGNIPNKLAVMQNAIRHRGPDETDVILLDRAGFSMNRLAIVGPKVHSTILTSENGNYYAVFNGEIVNHRALRKILKNKKELHDCDSSIILPMFEQFGDDFAKKIAGMFAIAIYDKYRHTLKLYRDPLGIKPLYYSQHEGRVLFSSELKAINVAIEKNPSIDFHALDDSLRYRFHPGRMSVFTDVERVLPGEVMTFFDNKREYKKFWVLSPNGKNATFDLDENVKEFRKILNLVVAENTDADVKGGFFVSGGLDSSLITAIGLRNKSLYKTPLSLSFVPNQVEDEHYGKILEEHLNVRFEWVEVSDDTARKTLEEAVCFMDEPLENPIHIGTFLLAKHARKLGIKSVLTGDGSDEFFIGYKRHQPWFKDKLDPVTEYIPYLSTLTPQDADELYTKEAKSKIRPMLGYLGNKVEPFTSIDYALNFERFDRLTEYHCNRLDRMTMAQGVEARVPFLDRRTVEFALKIPHNFHFSLSGKQFLQKVAKPFLPGAILHRPKIHFPGLVDQWTMRDGVDWAANILLNNDAITRRWLKPHVLKRYFMEHNKKIIPRGRLIWALVTLELWLKNLQKYHTRLVL